MVLFFNLDTRRLIGSSDYTLDPSSPSGPTFNLNYNSGINFHLYNPEDPTSVTPSFTIHQPVFVSLKHGSYPSNPATIVNVHIHPDNPYMVQLTPSTHIIHLDKNIYCLPFPTMRKLIPLSPLFHGLSTMPKSLFTFLILWLVLFGVF